MEKSHKKIMMSSNKKQSFSVLQADQVFVKKILSRNSSAGNHSSNVPESFRAPAEVPFKWESRPGEPKDPPKKIDLLRPPPLEADAPPSTPLPPPRATTGPSLSRATLRRFLKKLVEKGNKWGSFKNNVGQRVAAASGFDHRDQRFTPCVGPSSSNFSFNNLGFSTASASSTSTPTSSSSKGYNLPQKRSSKLQRFSKGCIKSVF